MRLREEPAAVASASPTAAVPTPTPTAVAGVGQAAPAAAAVDDGPAAELEPLPARCVALGEQPALTLARERVNGRVLPESRIPLPVGESPSSPAAVAAAALPAPF